MAHVNVHRTMFEVTAVAAESTVVPTLIVPDVKNPPPRGDNLRSPRLRLLRKQIYGSAPVLLAKFDHHKIQTDSDITIYKNSLAPFFTRYEFLAESDNGEIQTLTKKLDDIHGAFDKLFVTSEYHKVKLENGLVPKTAARMREMNDDVQAIKNSIETLRNNSGTRASDIHDKCANLARLVKKPADLGQLNSAISDAYARLRNLEAKAKECSSNVTQAVNVKREVDILSKSTRKLNKRVDNLENDVIKALTAKNSSTILSLLTRKSNEVHTEIDTFTQDLQIVDMMNAESLMADAAFNNNVNSGANGVLIHQSTTSAFDSEMTQRLNIVESSLEQLEEAVETDHNNLQEQITKTQQSTTDDLELKLGTMKEQAAAHLKQLQGDWGVFHTNNGKAQLLVFNELEKIGSFMNPAITRISAAERRAKWCVDRVNALKMEEEKKMKLYQGDFELLDKLSALEQQLLAVESQLAEQDNAEATTKPVTVMKYESMVKTPLTPPPDPAMDTNANVDMKIPKKLRLAYPPNENMVIVLEKVPREPQTEEKTEAVVERNVNINVQDEHQDEDENPEQPGVELPKGPIHLSRREWHDLKHDKSKPRHVHYRAKRKDKQ